jgi:hypothetical protein
MLNVHFPSVVVTLRKVIWLFYQQLRSEFVWPAKAVFDAQVGAELIKLVLAGGVASAQAKEAVGEFLAIVYKYGPNPYWAA